MDISMHLPDGRKIEVTMPMLPRVGESIATGGKFYKIDELIYDLDKSDQIVIYTVVSPNERMNKAADEVRREK